MKNNWHEVWSRHDADRTILQSHNKSDIFLELKRSNGFDVIGDGLSEEALQAQYQEMKKNLSYYQPVNSVYEVGCGSGANIYLLEQDGIVCGGLDYSKNLLESAKQVLQTTDLRCAEAIELEEEPVYDALLSNSVFSYFEDTVYAKKVLEKMYHKADHVIALIDVHDKEKEAEFTAFRKASITDYEERYRNLPKLFYEKSFFEQFAAEHQMQIRFLESDVAGYWNNAFVFNCYMYKTI